MKRLLPLLLILLLSCGTQRKLEQQYQQYNIIFDHCLLTAFEYSQILAATGDSIWDKKIDTLAMLAVATLKRQNTINKKLRRPHPVYSVAQRVEEHKLKYLKK